MPNSLSCRAQIDHLAAALRVVMRIVPSYVGYQNSAYLIELKSDGTSLTLTSSTGEERATVTIPAQGEEFSVLVKGSDINKSIFKCKQKEVGLEYLLSKKRGAQLILHLEEDHSFEAHDEEKFCLLETKRPNRRNRFEVIYAGPALREIMDYLMKARNDKEDKPVINGLVFSTDKLALTDGHHMHVQGIEELLPFQAILPKSATDALHVGLQKFTPASVRVQYSPNSEAFVVVFTFDNSPKMSVRIDARGIELPQRFHEVCPPLDEAIGMVLAREPFEQLVKDVVRRKVGSLGLEFGTTGIRYHYDTPTQPGAEEVPETWGTLPSARTMGAIMKDRGFNPRFLLAAIESLGDPLQIIQTWVRADVRNEEGEVVAPVAGEDDDGFYPIIVNGQVPKRYAIIMPMR